MGRWSGIGNGVDTMGHQSCSHTSCSSATTLRIQVCKCMGDHCFKTCRMRPTKPSTTFLRPPQAGQGPLMEVARMCPQLQSAWQLIMTGLQDENLVKEIIWVPQE